MNPEKNSNTKQIRNSVIYMLPVVFGTVAPLITIPIFTRLILPKDYGILAVVTIFAFLMTSLANFGVTLVFERNYFEYKNNKKKLARLLFSSLTFIFTNFIILMAITYLLKDNISEFLTGSNNYGILIMITFGAQFFSSTASNVFYSSLINEEKAKSYSKYKSIHLVSNLIVSLFLVAYIKIGIIGIVTSQLITGLFLFFLLLRLSLKELSFALDKRILFESLKFSYPLVPSIFLKVLNTQFDKYMISLIITMSSVGVYHIGKKVSELVFAFMTAIENVFNPQVYQRMFGQHDEGSESIGAYLTPFFYISICMAFSIALFSEEIFTILTPESYHGAIPILIILSMNIGFQFFGKVITLQFLYIKKTHIYPYITLFSLGLNVALNIPMIMKFGAVGAAIATLFSGLISGSINILLAQRYYRIQYEWYKICCIIGTFYFGAIAIFLMHLLGFSYLLSLSFKVVILAFFINLGVKFDIVSKKNFRLVKSAVSFGRLENA
tara:strand:- start:2817 stop:4304 length:1488 start_codon:yes stop_codon:yes gene_type:complete